MKKRKTEYMHSRKISLVNYYNQKIQLVYLIIHFE